MAFILTSQNVLDYLQEKSLYTPQPEYSPLIELKSGKNFNLRVKLSNNCTYLIKQERISQEGHAVGEFKNEWNFHRLIHHFDEFSSFSPVLPQLLHFDQTNSIAIFKYLDQYQDLMSFYTEEKHFPSTIPSALGMTLATLHQCTLGNFQQQNFLLSSEHASIDNPVLKLIQELDNIGPEIFGIVSLESLKFFVLYQRYESLEKELHELSNLYTPACLTHSDLKFNNILLLNHWQHPDDSLIRLIDWERCQWGDPALDLGMLIASYLHIWLNSLIMSKSIAIEESLRLALIPLNQIQPSISRLIQSYLTVFSDITILRPDFLKCVVKYSGFALIQKILAMIQYQKPFNNPEIATLQVAMSLLCRTEDAMVNMFGCLSPETISPIPSVIHS